MPSVGRQHFEDYAPQTAAKHAILEKYFRAYLTALGPSVDAFHYVDGFAGLGTYGDGHPGSALLALSALADQPKPASVTLVEADPKTFQQLQESVRSHLHGLFEPSLENAEFATVAARVWQRPIYRRFRRVATFAFIDPCGVGGVRLEDIAALLKLPFAECLLFWNYEGLNRWIGGVSAGTSPPDRLREFFGDEGSLQAALTCFRSATVPVQKEVELRDLYLGNLHRQAGARFLVPFRFQARGKARTSHYLIHCSNNPLAFKIMKEVMIRTATEGGDSGVFEYLEASELGAQTSLFRPAMDLAREQILAELRKGDCPVSRFTKEWVTRAGDYLVEKQYRELLLSLEAEGLVVIIDDRTGDLTPAASRMRGGRPTLASRLIVRARTLDAGGIYS